MTIIVTVYHLFIHSVAVDMFKEEMAHYPTDSEVCNFMYVCMFSCKAEIVLL